MAGFDIAALAPEMLKAFKLHHRRADRAFVRKIRIVLGHHLHLGMTVFADMRILLKQCITGALMRDKTLRELLSGSVWNIHRQIIFISESAAAGTEIGLLRFVQSALRKAIQKIRDILIRECQDLRIDFVLNCGVKKIPITVSK